MNLKKPNGWESTNRTNGTNGSTSREKTNQTVRRSCSSRCPEIKTWAVNHRVGYELKLQIWIPGNNNVFYPGPGWRRGIPNLSRLGSTFWRRIGHDHRELFVPGFQCTWCWAGGGGGGGGGGVLASSPENIM